MSALDKYSHDAIKRPDQVGGVDRYVVVSVDQDDSPRPIIQRKSNGQQVHLTYKTLSIARDAAFGVSEASDQYENAAVFDKQYGTLL